MCGGTGGKGGAAKGRREETRVIGGGAHSLAKSVGRKGKRVDFGGASRACQPRPQSPIVYLAQHSMVTVTDIHSELRIWHQILRYDPSDRIYPEQRRIAEVFYTRLTIVALIL